jgi:hypothetical protein
VIHATAARLGCVRVMSGSGNAFSLSRRTQVTASRIEAIQITTPGTTNRKPPTRMPSR